MKIKEKVLDLLESHKGIYFSGEAIARDLDVSRAAVWKAITVLRSEGYSIDAVTNKGYSLSAHTDIISPQGIAKYLDEDTAELPIDVIPEADSTNTLVRQKANAGFQDGYTLIANAQTAGRGRSGRRFYSPRDTGIYLSMLLKPSDCTGTQAIRFTTMAAVAMCDAIRDICDREPAIKWVNDIFINGKKVCGILTEGSFSLETGLLDYAVLGLGINVYPPKKGFPEDLKSIAGVLFDHPQDDAKNRLIGAFLNHFYSYYHSDSHSLVVEKYRAYSLVIGKEITVLQNGQELPAVCRDIDKECRLLVTFPDGTTKNLSYGEIRIHI